MLSLEKILVKRKILFYLYSFSNKIFNWALNISPPYFRDAILRICLGEFGHHSFIDYGSYLRYPRRIRIGKKVEINRGFQAFPSLLFINCEVVIEDNVVIGPNVCLYGAGQKIENEKIVDVAGPIVIREGAYIGGSSIIRYGVEVGARSIVAAGSVVVKHVAAGTIVGGNPAKYLGEVEGQSE